MTSTIGSVRDQLASWGNRRPAEDAEAPPQHETIDGRDLTVLGTLGRSSFARTKVGLRLAFASPPPSLFNWESPEDAPRLQSLSANDYDD